MRRLLFPLLAALSLAACNAGPAQSPEKATGASPQLGPIQQHPIPVVKVARVEGWPGDARPQVPAGFTAAPFAEGLNHPRWLYMLPNGDLLVAETNGPAAKPKDFKGWVSQQVMKEAGAGVASPDRILLFRDADGDGVPETKTVFLKGLHSPFGMALVGDWFYVANTDAVLRFPYRTGETRIAAAGQKVLALNAEPPDYHWARNLLARPDGSKIYVTVGTNSNIGENGMETEAGRAAIHEFNPDGSGARIFASGMRNPNGLAWEPTTGALWAVVNERDELGNDIPPDYLTSVKDGAFYGWPWSYWGKHVDARVKPQRPDMVAKALTPDYALGAHVAPLGLAFYTAGLFPPQYRGGAFIGEHGSWNRQPPSGYQVVYVPFAGGKPSGPPQPFMTGFLSKDGHAYGRPVGVAVDARGALLVADDVGNIVWRIAPTAASSSSLSRGPMRDEPTG